MGINMSIFNLLSLFGGLAMFLYGMRLMGDGLKESSSGALKKAMEAVTNNPFKAFLLGVVITALIQSSTATIVITSGLVGAGILTLHQSLGIIIGANVGTTVTGQIIRLLDLDSSSGSFLQLFKPSTLAPVALIIGIVLIMAFKFKTSRAIGNIAIGFGILFSGLLDMTGAVNSLTGSPIIERLFTGLGDNPFIGYVTGAGVAFVLQSSSATIGILQAFSQSGLLTFKAVYPVIIGIYLGDCVTTAIVCSIGANTESRRVGIVNILFNLSETVLVFTVITIIHKMGFLTDLWNATVNSGMIANTNTIFNLCCAIALFPMLQVYENTSKKLLPDKPEPDNKYKDKLEALNPVFFNTPAIALNSCYDLLLTMLRASITNIDTAFTLLSDYNEKTHQEILAEEDNIDLMTDRVSRYMVELLPHLKQSDHVAILDQYYKVVTDFERLGDHAVNIAECAQDLSARETSFSTHALSELSVLHDLIDRILGLASASFEKRDVDAAYQIEPLSKVTDDMISTLKVNHLNRMGRGECNIYADANFMNLLTDIKRISDVSSNIGEATVIRANPKLGQDEHSYFSSLHQGQNESFNRGYEAARKEFFGRLEAAG